MAGITHLQEFQKPALRGLVDVTVQERVPTLADRFMPDDRVFSTTFAYDIVRKTKTLAAYIGYGAEPPVMDRDAVASKMGELAKLGLKYIATEEELLALNQARSDAEKSAIIDKLTVKAIDLVTALQTRVDISKMEAITKGLFTYNKNGVKINVDYGIPANHKVALSSGNDWTDINHDVIGDLMDWVATYEATNGKQPDVILMTRETQALLLKNTVIVAEAGRSINAGRVSVEELNSVLGGYGLPPVEIVTNRKVTVKDIYTGNDEVIEFMPVNRVVMASAGVGNYLYGPTVESDYQPGIDLRAYDKFEPIESVIRVAAAGFPVVNAPALLFHADVYTP
jgi:hypothetical protein